MSVPMAGPHRLGRAAAPGCGSPPGCEERPLAQARQLCRVGDLDGLTADHDAPAGVSRGVAPIDLERDPAATARGIELGSFVATEHHHVAVEDEVDRKHDWPAVIHDSHPAQTLLSQQLEALGLGQLLPATLALWHVIHG